MLQENGNAFGEGKNSEMSVGGMQLEAVGKSNQ